MPRALQTAIQRLSPRLGTLLVCALALLTAALAWSPAFAREADDRRVIERFDIELDLRGARPSRPVKIALQLVYRDAAGQGFMRLGYGQVSELRVVNAAGDDLRIIGAFSEDFSRSRPGFTTNRPSVYTRARESRVDFHIPAPDERRRASVFIQFKQAPRGLARGRSWGAQDRRFPWTERFTIPVDAMTTTALLELDAPEPIGFECVPADPPVYKRCSRSTDHAEPVNLVFPPPPLTRANAALLGASVFLAVFALLVYVSRARFLQRYGVVRCPDTARRARSPSAPRDGAVAPTLTEAMRDEFRIRALLCGAGGLALVLASVFLLDGHAQLPMPLALAVTLATAWLATALALESVTLTRLRPLSAIFTLLAAAALIVVALPATYLAVGAGSLSFYVVFAALLNHSPGRAGPLGDGGGG